MTIDNDDSLIQYILEITVDTNIYMMRMYREKTYPLAIYREYNYVEDILYGYMQR